MNTSKTLLEEAYSNFKTRREHYQVSSAIEDMLEGGWSPALLLKTIMEVIEEEITKLNYLIDLRFLCEENPEDEDLAEQKEGMESMLGMIKIDIEGLEEYQLELQKISENLFEKWG